MTAKEKYKEVLTKNNLSEKEYKTKFTLKSFSEKYEIKKIKIKIISDLFNLCPFISFETENGGFGLADPQFIVDEYDKNCIVTEFKVLEDDTIYDIKLLPKILKFIKLEI